MYQKGSQPGEFDPKQETKQGQQTPKPSEEKTQVI